MRWPSTAEDRFWSKVDRRGDDDCWLWMGSHTTAGYGRFFLDGRDRPAHVVAYEWLIGPVPEGLQLDHVCHSGDGSCIGGLRCSHRGCINPRHLAPSTGAANVRRGINRKRQTSHCPRGHEYTPDNTRRERSGKRHCRTCDHDLRAGRP